MIFGKKLNFYCSSICASLQYMSVCNFVVKGVAVAANAI